MQTDRCIDMMKNLKTIKGEHITFSIYSYGGNKFVVEGFSQCMCMERSGCQMTPSKGKERLDILSVPFRFVSSLLH